MELTERMRRRGLIVILVATFFMWTGFFMVIPLISVHYVDDLGWAAAAIGIVLATRQLMQQGLAVFGGSLSDRFGPKSLVCAGMLVRSLGFASMAAAVNFPLLLFAAVLAALGGALFEAPHSAAIAALTTTDNRARFYSLGGVIGGFGMTLGPLVGAALLRLDFAFVCLASATCFFVNFLLTLFLLPNVRPAPSEQRSNGIMLALRDRPFMFFTALLMGFWFLWTQLTLALPLEAKALTGSSASVGLLYGINAGATVLLQYPLLRLAERWLRPLTILSIGVALMTIGLGMVAVVNSLTMLLVCVAIFSIGVVLVSPTTQTVTANMAAPGAVGAYFGVNMLSLALGGGLGSAMGGWLYGLGQQTGTPAIPWLVCAGVGIVTTMGLSALVWSSRQKIVQTQNIASVQGSQQS